MQEIFSPLEKRHAALFERMMKSGQLTPSFTISRLICLIIAIFVHLTTLGFATLTTILVILAFIALIRGELSSGFALVIVAILPLGITYALRPRLGKYPEIILTRNDYPELYALADLVADCLHSHHIDGIAFSEKYNASFHRAGLRQESMLTLGLPLWAMLNPAERVALVGHELAHGVNGDYTRGLVIGSAYTSLQNWHFYSFYFLRVRSFLSLVGIVLIIITGPPLWLLYRLMFYESQRAEYLADSLSASISGTDATISSLSKVQFGGQFSTFASNIRTAISPTTILERFKAHLETTIVDPTKMEKQDAETNWRATKFSLTHPPLPYRKQFLAAHRVETPLVKLSDEQARRLQSEFDPVAKWYTDMLIEGKVKV